MRRVFIGIGLPLLIILSGLLFLSWKAGEVSPKRKEIRYEVTDRIKN